MTFRNLWTCPSCKKQFANRNQAHSCNRYTVRGFLKGKTRGAIALFEKFQELVETCGPALVVPAKTRIAFQVRTIFAAVNSVNEGGMQAHVVLSRHVENPRFIRVEELTPHSFVHHFRIESPAQLDQEVQEWLKEAYQASSSTET